MASQVTERQRVVETPVRARRRGSRAEVSRGASGLEDAKKVIYDIPEQANA